MSALAIVFEPIHLSTGSPAFPGPLVVGLEERGYEVVRIDTSAACERGARGIEGISEYWTAAMPQILDAELLVGNALGGVVAHHIASTSSHCRRLFTISAPSRSTPRLAEAFTDVIEATRRGVSIGLMAHDAAVGAEGIAAEGARLLPEEAIRARLIEGLHALSAYRCSGTPGGARHLAIVGADSHLARRENVCECDDPEVVEMGGVGMRPHTEAPSAVASLLKAFLDEGETE